MDKSKDATKAAKKAAKAQAKLQKKLTKVGGGQAGTEPTEAVVAPRASTDSGPTPAERSAAAAERQVRLQRYRVWFAFLMVFVAVATFLVAVKPWTLLNSSDPPSEASPTAEDAPT